MVYANRTGQSPSETPQPSFSAQKAPCVRYESSSIRSHRFGTATHGDGRGKFGHHAIDHSTRCVTPILRSTSLPVCIRDDTLERRHAYPAHKQIIVYQAHGFNKTSDLFSMPETRRNGSLHNHSTEKAADRNHAPAEKTIHLLWQNPRQSHFPILGLLSD